VDDAPMSVRLLAVPGSHPCASVAAMLDAKGVTYERVDLLVPLSRVWLRLTGFRAGTVPALRLDGTRVQGSRAVARALDARWPEPPLFPADPEARARVEELESWGDGPLQETARRIVLWSLVHSPAAIRAASEGAKLRLRLPAPLLAPAAWPLLRADAAINGARAAAVRADLAALPEMLDRVDAWIAKGELGGSPPTAADYQISGSLRLLLTIDDLAPMFAGRPSADLARRLIPALAGHVPAGVLPASWLRD
jgi:glutathione S-transferase